MGPSSARRFGKSRPTRFQNIAKKSVVVVKPSGLTGLLSRDASQGKRS